MEDNLIELLKTFGFPVIRQGSLAPDQSYPNTFFTFWNTDEVEHSAYNNSTASVVYSFDVNVYSTNANTAYQTLKAARALLKSNGWVTPSRAYDVHSDEITHVGRGMEVEFLTYGVDD